ncbi:MAG TPA: RIP metalloprotease [Acidimicrobiales bacterium]|nr:RIP metalloprotease [Acidimicrobiales bacterium]
MSALSMENLTKVPDDPEALERRVGLLRLVIGIVLGLGVAKLTGNLGTVVVVAAVLLMIVLHEAGHLVAAKLSGMRVTEFFVFFGPRLWSVRKGETEYGLKTLPLGGYCKIPGMTNLEEVEPEDEDRSYRQQSFPRRFAVGVAGSATHFVLAFLILVLLNGPIGLVRYDKPAMQVGEITALATGPSPAQAAGFRVGDKILTVDGQRFDNWDDLPVYIRARPGREIIFEIERKGERLRLLPVTVDLREVNVPGRDSGAAVKEPTGFLGIGPAFPVQRKGPVGAVTSSVGQLGSMTKLTVGTLGRLFSVGGVRDYKNMLFEKGPAVPSEDQPRFLSPVGLVRVASEVSENGVRDVLTLLLGINIFVGLFNMVPLLPLDGGHVAIAIYERLRSRNGRRYHADVAKLMPAFYLMLLVLAFLGISSLYLDIVRPLNLQ